jgi:hypothetical protein
LTLENHSLYDLRLIQASTKDFGNPHVVNVECRFLVRQD